MLGFPDKADKQAEPGTGWTAALAELNSILHCHVVNRELTTFGCVDQIGTYVPEHGTYMYLHVHEFTYSYEHVCK